MPAAAATLVAVVSIDEIGRLMATSDGNAFDDRRDNAVRRVLADRRMRVGERVGMSLNDCDRRSDLLCVSGR